MTNKELLARLDDAVKPVIKSYLYPERAWPFNNIRRRAEKLTSEQLLSRKLELLVALTEMKLKLTKEIIDDKDLIAEVKKVREEVQRKANGALEAGG